MHGMISHEQKLHPWLSTLQIPHLPFHDSLSSFTSSSYIIIPTFLTEENSVYDEKIPWLKLTKNWQNCLIYMYC